MALTDDPNFDAWHALSRPGAEVDQLNPRIQFFFHLEFAINLWSHIDRELFDVFCFVLDIKSKSNAATLFYKTPNISDHFSLTGSLVAASESSLPATAVALWKTITKDWDKRIAVRNRLAHDPVTQIIYMIGSTSAKGPSQEQLSKIPPPAYQLQIERNKFFRVKMPADTAAVTLERIKEHIIHVHELETTFGVLKTLLSSKSP
jgi:hypothetical protein